MYGGGRWLRGLKRRYIVGLYGGVGQGFGRGGVAWRDYRGGGSGGVDGLQVGWGQS